jgi:rRNA processing protein Krr1/Pno1
MGARRCVASVAASSAPRAAASERRSPKLKAGKAAKAVSLSVAEEWRALIAEGVHATAADVTKEIVGPGGARVRRIEAASGARVGVDRDSGTVTLAGSSTAIARARALLDAVVTPRVTIDAAAAWGGLVVSGVHESIAKLLQHLIGVGGARATAIERSSGSVVWWSRGDSNARVFISGDPLAVDAARTAMEALVQPAATIDAGARWGHLVAAGVHGSVEDCVKFIVGARAARLQAIAQRTGGVVWVSKDCRRVFVSGEGPAVVRARAAIETLVVPAATIDVLKQWGDLISGGVHASVVACLGHLFGPKAERVNAVEAASGAGVLASKDSGRVFLFGEPECVEAARRAIDAVIRPGASLDVTARWGKHGARDDLLRRLGLAAHLHDGRSIRLGSGGYVWASKDCSRVFVSGAPEAVDAGVRELDTLAASARGGSVSGGGGGGGGATATQ